MEVMPGHLVTSGVIRKCMGLDKVLCVLQKKENNFAC